MRAAAQAERLALCELLNSSGPEHPTLCEGWTAAHLAAHLVIRERRPIAALGLIVPGRPADRLARLTSRWAADIPFDQLVATVRGGPPILLRAADGPMNLVEYFVHHEDIRRAAGDWTPREELAHLDDLIWARQGKATRLLTRGLRDVDLTLARPSGETVRVGGGRRPVTLIGEPGELVLYLFGRRNHAYTELDGDPDAVHELRTGRLGG